MTTGRIAGETIAGLKQHGAPLNKANLTEYRRRLNESFVMKDLKKYRKIPNFLHKNRHVFDLYPKLFSGAAQNWFRVNDDDKRTKEKQIMTSFRKGRTLPRRRDFDHHRPLRGDGARVVQQSTTMSGV